MITSKLNKTKQNRKTEKNTHTNTPKLNQNRKIMPHHHSFYLNRHRIHLIKKYCEDFFNKVSFKTTHLRHNGRFEYKVRC